MWSWPSRVESADRLAAELPTEVVEQAVVEANGRAGDRERGDHRRRRARRPGRRRPRGRARARRPPSRSRARASRAGRARARLRSTIVRGASRSSGPSGSDSGAPGEVDLADHRGVQGHGPPHPARRAEVVAGVALVERLGCGPGADAEVDRLARELGEAIERGAGERDEVVVRATPARRRRAPARGAPRRARRAARARCAPAPRRDARSCSSAARSPPRARRRWWARRPRRCARAGLRRARSSGSRWERLRESGGRSASSSYSALWNCCSTDDARSGHGLSTGLARGPLCETAAMQPSLRVLDDDLLVRIVEEAKRILAEIGVEVRGAALRERLLDDRAARRCEGRARALPARGRRRGDRARRPRPSRSTTAPVARTPSSAHGRSHFVPGSSGLRVIDRHTGEARHATTTDFVELVRLADGLEGIAYLATAFSTGDVPAPDLRRVAARPVPARLRASRRLGRVQRARRAADGRADAALPARPRRARRESRCRSSRSPRPAASATARTRARTCSTASRPGSRSRSSRSR